MEAGRAGVDGNVSPGIEFTPVRTNVLREEPLVV
jgi:hypothetical protein